MITYSNSSYNQEFPPTSKLDPELYGDQTSTIRREHIEKYMNGQTVEEVWFSLIFTDIYIYFYSGNTCPPVHIRC